MVHRDLKPSNVLIAEDGPRVIDFGISRAVESTALTQAGLVIGSPGFMSPEQAAGYEVGPPTDIFSLGAVLAFAATGEGPFGTGTTAALLYRVVHGDPSLDRVPAEVRPLIERCLAKDPSQRPTADGLLAEVGALQPTPHWLPDSIIRAFARDPASGPAPATAAGTLGSDAAVRSTAALGGLAALGFGAGRHGPRRPAPPRKVPSNASRISLGVARIWPVAAEEDGGGQVLVQLAPGGQRAGPQPVEDLDRHATGVGVVLQHVGRDGGDQDRMGQALAPWIARMR